MQRIFESLMYALYVLSLRISGGEQITRDQLGILNKMRMSLDNIIFQASQNNIIETIKE